ncbi:hypothetical protein TPHA_0D04420 [Tetrapisispora phaffii CBS 4417]|uniref:DDE-1 domain-containing protein n=1 Tax=Tetrapisispora phaffii (strain ATCC 24235 / CBS 4417 / NBRC 1672 / NRRL Y-8282 / UCD 70-5) TaxID=1071381 RepID=G8BS01_TETPH|nr:hypothetical protein TPHA_0D04420 [Tetrapisispora phaffii CBS 4417]CCE63076.1 hypothetical protein TPHA_0D04420 [Tetrapisispora phaffii CBS 4417]
MLSIEQKYNICLMAEKHPKWTQLDLAKWAFDIFQLDKKPSQGTVSRLLANKDTYMNAKKHEKHANRLRRQNNFLVRRILQEWLYQSIWNDMPVSIHILQVTSQSIWLNIPSQYREGNGIFSYRYIVNFLSKLNLNSQVLDASHKLKPKKIWRFEERSELKQLLDTFNSDDIFTVDETFLAYNLPLDYNQYESSKIQSRLEVLTMMLCSNTSGSEKLKPLVIGKYNNYSSFKNYFPDSSTANQNNTGEESSVGSNQNLGRKMSKMFNISYRSNSRLILTSNIFHDWLVRWDKRLISNDRKVCLILDDSCSHRIVNSQLSNITLVYTCAATKFLPFNWGVLDEFKIRYRIKQYDALIDLQQRMIQKTSKRQLINFEQSELTMSNAFKFIEQVWKEIPAETISSSWRCSGIISSNKLPKANSAGIAFKRNTQLDEELAKKCELFDCVKKWDYELLLDLNIENKYRNLLNSKEIIESAIVEEFEPEFHSYKVNANKIRANKYSPSHYHSRTDIPNNKICCSPRIDTNSNNLMGTNELQLADLDRESLNFDTKKIMSEFSSNKKDINLEPSFEIEKFLEETTDNLDNNLFNVSTLIDNPDLFIMPTMDFQFQPSSSMTNIDQQFPQNTLPVVTNNTIVDPILVKNPPEMLTTLGTSETPEEHDCTSLSNNLSNNMFTSRNINKVSMNVDQNQNIVTNTTDPNMNETLFILEETKNNSENINIIKALEYILNRAENKHNIILSDQSITEIRSNISYLKNKINKPPKNNLASRYDNYIQDILDDQLNLKYLHDTNSGTYKS